MKNQEMNVIELSTSELKRIEGGLFLALAALVVSYIAVGVALCYSMGKDGKSGYSHAN